MKKKLILFTLLLLLTRSTFAGDGDSYLGIQTGVLYPRIFNATLSYEKEIAYHNAWEVYIDYATQWDKCSTCGRVCTYSFWKEKFAYAIGSAYKPVILRGKNNFTRLRIGADLGASNRKFALGVEVGFEFVHTFKNGWQFIVQQKNEVTFWGKPTFKNGALLGVRFPI